MRARELAKVIGGRKDQNKRLGLRRKVIEDEQLAKLKKDREKQQAKVAQLKAVRKRLVSELAGLGVHELLEQINVFRLVDKINVKLKDSSTKLAGLETLADLIEQRFGSEARDRSQEWLEKEAGRKAPAQRKATRSRGQRGNGRTWPLDEEQPIQGARVDSQGRREYLVRWQGTDPDAPGEKHWETWEYFASLCVDGNIRAQAPPPPISPACQHPAK